MSNTISINCETCGKTFTAKVPEDRRWVPGNWCSNACYAAYGAKMKAAGFVAITPENNEEISRQLEKDLGDEAKKMTAKKPTKRFWS